MSSKGADITIEQIQKQMAEKKMKLLISVITMEEEVESGDYMETVSKLADYIKSRL